MHTKTPNKELLVLRHGKSDWSRSVGDFQRPLKTRGQQEAARIGAWLAAENLRPELVISSPAERARGTAEAVCAAMAYPPDNIAWDESVYMADVDDLLESLARAPAHCQRLLIVGHNPGLEYLLLHLVGHDIETPPDGKLLPTATLALMRITGGWTELEAGAGELLQLVRGRGL